MEQELMEKARRRRRRIIGVIALLAIAAALAVFGLRQGTAGSGEAQPSGEDGQTAASAAGAGYVTLEITCRDLADHMDRLTDEAVREYVPEDGEILPPERVAFAEGDSVYDVLYRTCREKGIQLETREDPVYESRYVEGIGHLYELDAGERSGWTYEVNGAQPDRGCSEYTLKNGESVRWIYVTDYTKPPSGETGAEAGGTGAGGPGEGAD